jgi:hypothetical protein
MQCITVDVFVLTVCWFSSGTPVSSTNKTDRNDIRHRALFTCGDGPVHSYFFLPKIFMSIHHFFKKKFMPCLSLSEKKRDPANKSDCL